MTNSTTDPAPDQSVARPRVALATCSVLPRLDPDDAPLVGALDQRGVEAVPAVWDDPGVDWESFDAVVVRSTYDYSARRDEFVSWAASVPNILNPEAVLRWNTHKFYLRDLETAGIPVIPTVWLDPERNLSSRAIHTRMPAHGHFVIKPVVSAGAKDTGRYEAIDAESRGLAILHAKKLLAQGRHVMVQPYVMSIDTEGEARLVFVDGELSHAVSTSTRLTGPHRPTQGLYRKESMRVHEPDDAQVDVARRALAVAAESVPGVDPLLYARVDLVWGADGSATVLELELTEASLYLSSAPGALERFADAIAARVSGGSGD
ncbi:hypothetical protein CLV28_0087 [Sediminihabitans luteus]|uniref:ATP-grasp domain-containing protein n=1 Tax=Sediminihabitans luteus TaxID=1138585 RepID=A0A2M9CYR1_9CELL|nr:hypothetical protein [Sediminihabitans luteus]PJJ76878.1 hypothetical protein CLV28_0087 [Sediminihabitans luteus]GIJ00358.1 ATP-grasp domain-containing protein [Sediminihabitans luteus]